MCVYIDLEVGGLNLIYKIQNCLFCSYVRLRKNQKSKTRNGKKKKNQSEFSTFTFHPSP